MKKLLVILLLGITSYICISCKGSYTGKIVGIRHIPTHKEVIEDDDIISANLLVNEVLSGYTYTDVPDSWEIIVVNPYEKNRKYRSFTHIIKDPSLLYPYHIGDSVFLSLAGTLEVVDPDT